jgi:hypothetical protein
MCDGNNFVRCLVEVGADLNQAMQVIHTIVTTAI